MHLNKLQEAITGGAAMDRTRRLRLVADDWHVGLHEGPLSSFSLLCHPQWTDCTCCRYWTCRLVPSVPSLEPDAGKSLVTGHGSWLYLIPRSVAVLSPAQTSHTTEISRSPTVATGPSASPSATASTAEFGQAMEERKESSVAVRELPQFDLGSSAYQRTRAARLGSWQSLSLCTLQAT